MASTILPTVPEPAPAPSAPAHVRRTVGQRVWVGISSAGAVALGILPHILHHISLFAGALFAGVGGPLLFGTVGFVAAIPFLLRVYRRTGTWRMPAALLTLFAVIFSISTFVIGPAITGDSEKTSDQNTLDHTKKDNHGH